jgi:hypothetical protein
VQYEDELQSYSSVFHTSVETPSQSKILETVVDNSATEYNSHSVVKHVSPELGLRIILHSASKSVLNSDAEVPHNNANVSTSLTTLPKVCVLELTPDVNGSSRHAKHVLVNVTNFTFSSPSEYTDDSLIAGGLINKSLSPTLDGSVSDVVVDVPAGFTRVPPPTPLILAIDGSEGKT